MYFSMNCCDRSDDIMHVMATACYGYGDVLFTPNLQQKELREISNVFQFERVNNKAEVYLTNLRYEELPNQNGGDNDFIIVDEDNKQFIFVENGCEHFTDDAIAKLNRPWFERTDLKSYCKEKFPFINYK